MSAPSPCLGPYHQHPHASSNVPSQPEQSGDFAAAASIVRDQADEIVERWVRVVRTNGILEESHASDLRDHLPKLLEKMAADLESPEQLQSDSTEQVAQQHGRQRWQLGWKLEDVVRDYQTLRPVLLKHLSERLPAAPSPSLVTKLADMIDEAVIDSIGSYTRYHDSIESNSHRTAAEFAAIIASSTDAIISMDTDGAIRTWNGAAERIYGYSVEEAIGKSARLTYPPDRHSEFDEYMSVVHGGRSIQSTDMVQVTKAGDPISVALSISPIVNRAGRVIGCASIAHDISQRIQGAEALRRALEEAESANHTKDQFLANVSHELRSPMNAIVGMTDLALDEELSDDVRDHLRAVREAASQLRHLVDDLLDVSKLEAGKFELDSGPFALRTTLDDSTRLAGLRAYEKGIEIICNVASDVPDLLIGDALRLKQVLNNLLSNAVKFTEQGEVVLDVAHMATGDRICRLLFKVTDTGIGIAEENRKRIFSPFTQVDSTSTRRFGGTGLGLSIASHLVACLGGELRVDSTPDVGSTFSFEAVFQLPDPDSPLAQGTPSADQLRGVTAIVVDDNETSRAALRNMLANWNMEVLVANTADAAVAKVQQLKAEGNAPEIAFIDALMPGTDGFDVIKSICELAQPRPGCVLMIAPGDRRSMRDRCSMPGIDDFLEKPISQSGVLDALGTVLSERSMPRSNSAAPEALPEMSRPLDVLIVEDTTANRKVVERVLEKRGHQCLAASNGREAFAQVQERDFDVILMDVQMPIMDGFQATVAIREWERTHGDGLPTPIIAMTAHAMRGDRDRCLAAGMTDYIAKPIDIVELTRLVERLGGGLSAPQSPSATTSHPQTGPMDSPSASTEAIDIQKALSRLRGDREILTELAQCFLEDYPELLEQFKQSLSKDDAPEVRRAAHSLKGMAKTFDAQWTPRVALAVEQHAAAERLDEAAKLADELQAATAALADCLRPLAEGFATD